MVCMLSYVLSLNTNGSFRNTNENLSNSIHVFSRRVGSLEALQYWICQYNAMFFPSFKLQANKKLLSISVSEVTDPGEK
jgi:hypothetical protein